MLKNNKHLVRVSTLRNHYGGYDYVSNALIVGQETREVFMKTTGGKSAFSHFNKYKISCGFVSVFINKLCYCCWKVVIYDQVIIFYEIYKKLKLNCIRSRHMNSIFESKQSLISTEDPEWKDILKHFWVVSFMPFYAWSLEKKSPPVSV